MLAQIYGAVTLHYGERIWVPQIITRCKVDLCRLQEFEGTISNPGSPSEVSEFVWVNAESPSSMLGCDSRDYCMSSVADAMRRDGEQLVFLWIQVSLTVQPPIIKKIPPKSRLTHC
ncbi:hypothetical protein llap_9804 [Limosa lapponica baueri]|uniref:Uncharacterized protein n=1 Tax=Limosa lapponica baueri TaxID=1758121 RepID=A0A2I0U1E3_LIMLA|nr:hypothetical protein llap_9804 [Limosa lapponica baueri]